MRSRSFQTEGPPDRLFAASAQHKPVALMITAQLHAKESSRGQPRQA